MINTRLPNQYVKSWEEFTFEPNVLAAIRQFNTMFGVIVVVTNQQGIGKGLMSENDLEQIHHKMLSSIEQVGGRIDKIYYCPDLKTKIPNCRKPSPQMAWQARQDFPSIDFRRSIIVGDSISDMAFGFDLNMKTVFIETKPEDLEKSLSLPIDYRFPSLHDFALALK